MNDYYKILEVEPNASQDQIKNQYRFLVQAWHPDKFGSPETKAKAEEKLKQINEAYDLLKDPIKREQYNHQRQYSQKGYDHQARDEYERQRYEQEARKRTEAEKRRKEQAEAQRREQEAKVRAEREAAEGAKQEAAEKVVRERARKLNTPIVFVIIGVVIIFITLPRLFSGHTTTFIPTFAPAASSKTRAPAPMPTESFVITPTPLPTEITDAKGVPMRFVLAGNFIMGSDNYSYAQEKPVHTVYLDSFYIDKYEVTNALYKACVDTGLCSPPKEMKSYTRNSYYGNSQYDDYPVIYVDWNMSNTYCQWRGAQLPTEAQWEKAARGTDGRDYPWGEGIACSKANSLNCSVGDTAIVGSYKNGVSPYGIYDMAGNVWEWVADWYSETYYQNSPQSNPLGPESGQYRALRGGAFGDSDLRVSNRLRDDPANNFYSIGFRCARSAP